MSLLLLELSRFRDILNTLGHRTGTSDAIIVKSAIELGHNLGLKVIAEGVEDQRTLDRLAGLGCDAAQGYFFARPMSDVDLRKWLLSSPWSLKRPEVLSASA